ncbi:hypothetical protein PPACK8108_LOCUS25315 [Phakopsora pachyrhizi]|uniref:Uncharacterized protein n=1 Tax=Phakopsora pachyrhizi TaxID=170000 RepID=A0AAV0BV20_PHAPC|nr:hypothetical protein PPACK8108_LOCUS25315 [Phakopsora pachyrhizi]
MGVQTQKRVPLASGGEEIGSHVIPEGAVASSTAHVCSSGNAHGNNNHSLSYKSIISHRTPSSSITVGQSSASNCPTSLNLAARLEEDLEPVQASKIIVRVRFYKSIGKSASTSSRPEINSSITNPHHPPSSSSSSSSYSSHKSTPNKGGNALGSITYKNWRTWWSLKAVIYHQPMGNYGSKIMKSYQLHLPNYYNSHQQSQEHLLSTNSLNLPDHQQQQQHSENQISNKTQLQSTKSYGLRYSIKSPTCLACGDPARLLISISYPNQPRSSSVCIPSQPRFSIKCVSVGLVRTISTESVSSNPEDQSKHLSKPR